MTDKQIIIDGVDVSYCPNHYNGWSALHRDHRPMCECGYDRECKPKNFECSHYVKCLEKQLRRKEQECEELKKEQRCAWKSLEGTFCPEAQQQLGQLKAENEKLKKAEEYDSRYNDMQAEIDCGERMIKQLKQTLTEIKEIAEILAPMTDEYDSCYYKDRCSKCEVKEDCQYFKVEQILQKISEVENEITTR